MAILDIVTFPTPSLRLKSKKVSKFDAELQTLIDNMFETMRAAPGVGLAAPQIGQSIRLVVVEYKEDGDENAKPRKYVLVNPEIIKRSEEKVTDIEGCLSVPGLAGKVERHEAITVRAKNRFGKPLKIDAEGWLARIFQHEIDHLDGVLYIDRAEEVFEPTPEEAEQIKD
ncbi:MAG: peptide deformylase [Anaerolineaceae bacterium]|jgi:peptide deformylase|nr:peptide deformylase [Anaerolineaceae bacterium]MDI9531593.1 peptide deformylase [Chloroflexota bacterium]NLE93172.1 peptide deformylase [Chloroflexota bacterium]HNZ16467.1 peptide deformylase [Anaerolineaceae bacterium]HOF29167.1 peptide deformylase [Anaerolineaceae bacterium]